MDPRTRRLLAAVAAVAAGGVAYALSADPLLAATAGIVWGIVGDAASEQAALWYRRDRGVSKWAALPGVLLAVTALGTNGISLSVGYRVALLVHLLGAVLAAMHVGYALAREDGLGERRVDSAPAD